MNNKKIFENASWIIGAQIVKSCLGVIISMLTARYLGPSNYGLINYAASIVAFVSPIVYLGLNGVLVQELIGHPQKEGETLGTAICMSLVSSIFCIIGVILFVSVANRGEKDTMIVCSLYSILLVFQSADLIVYWFQAKLLSRYSSIVTLCAYGIVSLYKFFLLATKKSIYWFALSNALDYFLISTTLILIYLKIGGQKISVSKESAVRMFSKSKYYIVSNMMIAIFAQTDRIMLKIMVDDASTGVYSAAVSCAGLANFVFSAIIDSMRPAAFEAQKKSREHFENYVVTLYSIVIYISILYSAAMSILAPLVIKILYGIEYAKSVNVLRIIVWYCTFSYLGGARDIWILAENKQKYLITLYTAGALGNLILNYFLIPFFDAEGAAIASLLTQLFVNIVFVSIYKPTRRNGVLMLKACSPKYLRKVAHSFIRKK